MGSPEELIRESLRPWRSKELSHRVMMTPEGGVGEARETVDEERANT